MEGLLFCTETKSLAWDNKEQWTCTGMQTYTELIWPICMQFTKVFRLKRRPSMYYCILGTHYSSCLWKNYLATSLHILNIVGTYIVTRNVGLKIQCHQWELLTKYSAYCTSTIMLSFSYQSLLIANVEVEICSTPVTYKNSVLQITCSWKIFHVGICYTL